MTNSSLENQSTQLTRPAQELVKALHSVKGVNGLAGYSDSSNQVEKKEQ
jgi:hypothetical protein